jgi:hypothetical protein
MRLLLAVAVAVLAFLLSCCLRLVSATRRAERRALAAQAEDLARRNGDAVKIAHVDPNPLTRFDGRDDTRVK